MSPNVDAADDCDDLDPAIELINTGIELQTEATRILVGLAA